MALGGKFGPDITPQMHCKFHGVHVSRYYGFDLAHCLEGYSDLIRFDKSENLKSNAGLLS